MLSCVKFEMAAAVLLIIAVTSSCINSRYLKRIPPPKPNRIAKSLHMFLRFSHFSPLNFVLVAYLNTVASVLLQTLQSPSPPSPQLSPLSPPPLSPS